MLHSARIDQGAKPFDMLLWRATWASISIQETNRSASSGDEYLQLEELAGGTGYADIVYLPKRNSDYPALVIELKALDRSHPQNDADGAIAQIKNRNYPNILKNYTNEILLVGISHDKDDPDKTYICD